MLFEKRLGHLLGGSFWMENFSRLKEAREMLIYSYRPSSRHGCDALTMESLTRTARR